MVTSSRKEKVRERHLRLPFYHNSSWRPERNRPRPRSCGPLPGRRLSDRIPGCRWPSGPTSVPAESSASSCPALWATVAPRNNPETQKEKKVKRIRFFRAYSRARGLNHVRALKCVAMRTESSGTTWGAVEETMESHLPPRGKYIRDEWNGIGRKPTPWNLIPPRRIAE